MHQVIENSKCCGCGTCLNVCPKNAITMCLDDEGFEYPNIDQNFCVNCGICQRTCPVLQYESRQETRAINCEVQKGFVARNNNYEQRLKSSSGSIFPPIAEWILDQGGCVIGAAYDSIFNTVHRIVEKKEDLESLQGSKYLQVKVDETTFKYIRQELQNGRIVLYAGMACQVEGLKAFLRKDYENLYTIDLICMGIPSYEIWQLYLKNFFPNEHIKSVNFKEKSIGWDSFVFRIETEKRVFQERGKQNLYLQSMFRTWNMRPSCFQCPFKKAVRISDFTLADAWGTSKYASQINDNKGLSSVIVHSRKGLELWEKIGSNLECIEMSIDEIAKGNSNLISNKPQMGGRERFHKTLRKNPRKAFEKLCSVRKPFITTRILKKIRGMLCK